MSRVVLQDRVSAMATLRQKLANNRDRRPTELAARAVAFSAATIRSRYRLRKATSLGVGVRILGHPPVIHNDGVLRLGNDVKLEAPVVPIFLHVFPAGELILGNNVAVNDGVRFECTSSIRIGDRVRIGFGVAIIDNHFHEIYDREKRPAGEPIVIENDAWIAAKAVIMPGVTIGEGSVVAAGCVVPRDVPPFTVVAGNPARVIRTLDAEEFKAQFPAQRSGVARFTS